MRVRRVSVHPDGRQSDFHTRIDGQDYVVQIGSHGEGGPFYVRVMRGVSGELLFEADPARMTVIAALEWAEDEIRERYERSKRRTLSDLETGFHLGGGPLPQRDEIYDR